MKSLTQDPSGLSDGYLYYKNKLRMIFPKLGNFFVQECCEHIF